MAIPADKLGVEAAAAEAAGRRWTDHVARTTAVLAVLAAVASGAYASQFSHTILAQTEASDQWSYYQAKSIKRHISTGQLELERALAAGRPLPVRVRRAAGRGGAFDHRGERRPQGAVAVRRPLRPRRAGDGGEQLPPLRISVCRSGDTIRNSAVGRSYVWCPQIYRQSSSRSHACRGA